MSDVKISKFPHCIIDFTLGMETHFAEKSIDCTI